MNDDEQISGALAAAKTVLESQGRGPVVLGRADRLDSPHMVLRVAVEQGAGLPESVVVKQLPEDARFGAKQRVMSEWVGLEFAGIIAGSTPFAPQFLGGDADQRLIVLEDLGEAPSLNHILHYADRDTALERLQDYGEFLGEFHGAAYGREAEFLAIQARLDAETPLNDSSVDLRERIEIFRAAFFPLTDHPDALEREIVDASTAMHDDHPYRSFQHHDAGPHNVLVATGGLRFVDFEFARYDNALLDMTAVRLAFPPFGEGHLLPRTAVEGFENRYREALSAAIPEIEDDNLYQLTLEQACAKWIVTKNGYLGEQLLPQLARNEPEDPPNPQRLEQIAYFRNLNFTWMTAYLQWFGDSARLPYTRDAIRRLFTEIKHSNPEIEAAGMYAAFASA